MKILFVCPYVPTPMKRRPLDFLLHLARRHDLHLRVLARHDEIRRARRSSDIFERLGSACASVEVLPVTLPAIAASCAAGYARGESLRVAYAGAHARYGPRLDRDCERLGIDVVHVDRLRLAPIANALSRPAVVDLPDCMSWRMEQSAGAAWGPQALFYRAESRRLRRFEATSLNRHRLVLAASDEDADKTRASGYRGEVRVVPCLIDLDETGEADLQSAGPVLLFHGNLSYFPNVHAMTTYVRDVFGELRRRFPALQLAIVGARPNAAMRALDRVDGVRIVADVPHVAPWLRAATAVIAPIRVGAGHSQKVCEAVWAGRGDLQPRGGGAR